MRVLIQAPLVLLLLTLFSGILAYEIPKEQGPIKIEPLKPEDDVDYFEVVLPNGEIRNQSLNPATRNWTKEEATDYARHKKTGRILGGKVTRINEVPYQVMIGLYGFGIWCGGTVYNKLWVVSAAHCFFDTFGVRDPGSHYITAGDFDITRRDQMEESRDVVQIIPHEKYDPKAAFFDIALIKLDKPLVYSQDVQPLPIEPQEEYPESRVGIVSGWGYTKPRKNKGTYDKDGYDGILKSTQVHVYTRDECKQTYENTRQLAKLANDPAILCAGELRGGIDACQGDSGGPLACYGRKAKYHCGVISTGAGCGQPQKPGFYTIVSKYSDWIKKNAGDADQPTRAY